MFTGHEVKGTVASTKPELAKFLRGKVETATGPTKPVLLNQGSRKQHGSVDQRRAPASI
jgi:hypothetical protein